MAAKHRIRRSFAIACHAVRGKRLGTAAAVVAAESTMVTSLPMTCRMASASTGKWRAAEHERIGRRRPLEQRAEIALCRRDV